MTSIDEKESGEGPLRSALDEFYEIWLSGANVDPDRFCEAHPQCGPELRAEIEDFLFVAPGIPEPRPAPEEETRGTPEDPFEATGATLGDFRIVREIGHGGMGVVYEAEQISLHRRVALKVLSSHLRFSVESVAKFRREAEAGARQSHPGIVTVHAVGEHNGVNYIAQELVEGGQTLEGRLREVRDGDGPRGGYFRETARLFAEIAEALQHAHDAGVVHRDIKPSNILLTLEGNPKITDFGLAKIEDALSLSRTGDFAGTPYYMSPEQAGKRPRTIDHRTDVFSLGVTLYEAMTLERPFDADSTFDVLTQILTCEPREPRKVNPRVPRDLSVICLKAMEKNPDRRYPSAAELAADLRRYLDGDVIHARPAGPATRTFKWARRHRVVSGTSLAVILLLIALVGWGLGSEWRAWRRYTEDLSRAERLAASENFDEAVWAVVSALDERRGDARASSMRREYIARRDEKKTQAALVVSEGNRITLESFRVLPQNPELALLLAIESAKRIPGLVSSNAVMEALRRCRMVRILFHGRYYRSPNDPRVPKGRMLLGDFSPDGRRVLLSSYYADNRVFDVASRSEILGFGGRTEYHNAPCFSPDGQTVPTDALGYQIAIRDASTGEVVSSLRGHTDSIRCSGYSPDGRLLATGSADGTARIWDCTTGAERVVLRGHDGTVNATEFSPDGRIVGTVGEDGTVRFWDTSTGEEQRVLHGHEGCVNRLEFSRDGRRAVTTSHDHTARIWDVSTGEEVATLRSGGSAIFSVTYAFFSADGKRVLAALGDPFARLWDAHTGEVLATYEGHDSDVRLARLSPDETRVVTAGFDRTARIWDTASGKELAILRGHEGAVLDACFSPAGDRVLTLSEDGTARIWEVADRRRVIGPDLYTTEGGALVFATAGYSRDGRKKLKLSENNRVAVVCDTKTGDTITVLRGHEGPILGADFSPDATKVVTGSEDRTARIWDAATGRELFVLHGHEQYVLGGRFSDDGRWVVTGGDYGLAKIWDVESGREIPLPRVLEWGSFPDGRNHVWAARLSPDRKRLYIGAYGSIAVWEIETGAKVASYAIDQGRFFLCFAFSPDGSRIAAGSETGKTVIWRVETGECITILEGHAGAVRWVAFSPDGAKLVTASTPALKHSGDASIRIWDLASGRESVEISDWDWKEALALGFSGDGSEVVCVYADGTREAWPVDVLAAACARKPRELYLAEKERFDVWDPGEREAAELVRDLFETQLFVDLVVREIQSRDDLEENVREAALRFARFQIDPPEVVRQKADLPLCRPYGSRVSLEESVRYAEAHLRRDPLDQEARRIHATALTRLAFEGRGEIDAAMKEFVSLYEGPRAENIDALILVRLGREDEAEAFLARGDALLQRLEFHERAEYRAIVSEADAALRTAREKSPGGWDGREQ